MPSRAVITVSYDSDAPLTSFLDGFTSTSLDDAVVVVADNAPSIGHAASIARAHGAQYLPMPANLGYGAAINRAFQTLPASVEWILVSNPDVLISAEAIETLITTAEADPLAGSVGPLVRNVDGSIYPSARQVPSIRTGVGHALLANIWPNNPWTRRYHDDDSASPRVREAGWLSGSCLLISREAFESVNGFDEEFFMYFEDVDLGYRLQKAGWRNVYQPSAEVTHIGAQSTGKSSDLMLRAHHRSAERFIAKKYSRPIYWPLRAFAVLGLRVRSAVARRASRPRG